ncbi:MAG: Fur family transcriptional regulator [Pseudomonadota bacterium]
MKQRVLAILRRRKRPASAYEVLNELKGEYPKLAPMTVYRVLSVLMAAGQAHRVESMNAFIACKSQAHKSASILSICDDCGVVEETISNDLVADLSRLAGKSGFTPQRHVIEIHGQCGSCCDGGGLG